MSRAIHKTPLPPEILSIGQALREAGGRPVLVGGWVRDYLLDDPHSKDFDLEVFGLDPEVLHKLLRKFGPVVAVGKQFGVLRLSTREADYDISVPRRESKTGKGHKGFWVEADPSMSFEEAAARRDFSINAMGYAIEEGQLLDPHGGQRDLESRLLRHVGPAFGEDPMRVMRAMQFAGRFSLTIAPETLAICREQDLGELPRERIWEEFKKLLLRSPEPSRGLAYAEPLGILPHFPELERLAGTGAEAGAEAGAGGIAGRAALQKGPWRGTLAAVDRMARLRRTPQAKTPRENNQRGANQRKEDQQEALVLMLAALCHRMGPAEPAGALEPADSHGAIAGMEASVTTFLQRLTNEAGIMAPVLALLREQAQPALLYARKNRAATDGAGQDSAIRRLALRVQITLLEKLGRACHQTGQSGEQDAAYPAGDWLLERAAALGVLQAAPEPLLKGRHLQEEGFPPGRAMGKLLKQAFDLQLDGRLTTLAEAQTWAREAWAAMPPLEER